MQTMKTKGLEVMIIGGMAMGCSPASEGTLLVSNKVHPKNPRLLVLFLDHLGDDLLSLFSLSPVVQLV